MSFNLRFGSMIEWDRKGLSPYLKNDTNFWGKMSSISLHSLSWMPFKWPSAKHFTCEHFSKEHYSNPYKAESIHFEIQLKEKHLMFGYLFKNDFIAFISLWPRLYSTWGLALIVVKSYKLVATPGLPNLINFHTKKYFLSFLELILTINLDSRVASKLTNF